MYLFAHRSDLRVTSGGRGLHGELKIELRSHDLGEDLVVANLMCEVSLMRRCPWSFTFLISV